MSIWYKTGTIAVTNGSSTVTGTGTAFVASVNAGDALIGPDDRSYEITAISSNTSLTITPAYRGATASGQEYGIQPTRALTIEFNESAVNLLALVQSHIDGALAGKFANGTAGTPALSFASDTDTGLFRPAANQLGLAAGGAQRGLLSSSALNLSVPITGTPLQSSAIDETAGKLLAVGAFGLGSGTPPEITDFEAAIRPGFYQYAEDTAAGAPGDASSFACTAVVARASNTGLVILAGRASAVAGSQRFWLGARPTFTGAIVWQELYHTANTTVDGNGFVKEASPIVRLFSDHIEEPVQETGASFARISEGVYQLTGTAGLAQSGWMIEVPQDFNGNRLVFVETDWTSEVLTITTTVPVMTGTVWSAGMPLDIPSGRWIDVRLHEAA